MAKDEAPEGDGYEFEVPDFDEDAFIHKEMVSFRTTSVLFVWGIVAALLSWGLWEATGANKTGWYLGLFIMAVFGYLLRYVYKALKIDIAHFGRREWFGTFFLLFFAWLAFFILFVNPPISDHADPTVNVFASPSVQQLGGDVNLDVFLADNGRIADFTISLTKGNEVIAGAVNFDDLGHGHHQFTLVEPAAGEYTYTVLAEDSKGNTAEATGSFLVKSRAIRVDLPDDGRLDSPGEEVIVSIDGMQPCTARENRDGGDCLRTVYLDLGDNEIPLEFDDNLGWFARNTFTGWEQGMNDFNVVAEQQNRFQGHVIIPGGDLLLGGFNVTIDAVEGTHEPVVADEALEAPITRRTPGVGAVALIGGLVALVAVRRRQE